MLKVVLSKAEKRRAKQLARDRYAKASLASVDKLLDELGKLLKAAHPRLIIRVQHDGDTEWKLAHSISDVGGWDELIDEGYDPDGSALGCPVYWRIVKRAGERLYYSTFPIMHEDVIRRWGVEGLAHCDLTTRFTVARIEAVLPETKIGERRQLS